MIFLALLAGAVVVGVAFVFIMMCVMILSGRISRREPLTPRWPWE
jgi:hypothetical protein